MSRFETGAAAVRCNASPELIRRARPAAGSQQFNKVSEWISDEKTEKRVGYYYVVFCSV